MEKPSHVGGGKTYSFQFYDTTGAAAFKVFLGLGGKLPTERVRQFELLRDRFRK